MVFYHTVNQTVAVLKDPSTATHLVLDVIGMIPMVGEVADLTNAGIYVAEGNYSDAGLSAAGAIPFVGWGATAAKTVKTALRTAEAADSVVDAARLVVRVEGAVPAAAAQALANNAPAVVKVDVPGVGGATPPVKVDTTPARPEISGPPVARVDAEVPSATSSSPSFFRGARPGEEPSFVPRPGEFKVDPDTGFVRDTHGVSVFDNPGSVAGKGFDPYAVDPTSVPLQLRVVQRGVDTSHYEIVPQTGADLTPEEFTMCLLQIRCER